MLSPLRSATVDEVLDGAEVENLVTEYTEYRKRLGWFGSVFLEGASLKARGGVTNNDGDSSSVSGVAEDLDKTEVDAGVEIGWYGRPIVRDFALRHFEQLQRPYLRYRNDRDKGLKRDDWIYWGLLDAVKLDLSAGYGTVLEDQQGDDNAKTTTKGLYTVRLRWEMPLGAHAGRNPLD